jgi:tRNA (guanine37-N1)-methyltransferase
VISFDILTIFPDQLNQFMEFGVFRIAKENNLLEYKVHDLRSWAADKHGHIDDRPYGGGAGMVIKVEPIFDALKELKKDNSKVILFTPAGKILDQPLVKELAGIESDSQEDKHYILLCGHYEGFDYRIHEHLADIEISLGRYVLSGGELPALILMDSITRLVPGVLGNEMSPVEESFEDGTLEHPHYTRPEEFNGWKVPEVLLSGNHGEIAKWRKSQSETVK